VGTKLSMTALDIAVIVPSKTAASSAWVPKYENVISAQNRWIMPAASNPPSTRDSVHAQPVYENLSVMPVSARPMKLTITIRCRLR